MKKQYLEHRNGQSIMRIALVAVPTTENDCRTAKDYHVQIHSRGYQAQTGTI